MLRDPVGARLHVRVLSADEARALSVGARSAVGHEDTASILAAFLGRPVQVERSTLHLSPGDALLVGQFLGTRLPEGAQQLPPGSTIGWYHVRVDALEQQGAPVVEECAPEAVAEPAPEAVAKPAPEAVAEPAPEAVAESAPHVSDTRSRQAILAEITKLVAWKDPVGADRERAALLARFPDAEGDVAAAEADGRAQVAAVERLDGIARREGADSDAFSVQARQIVGRWPFLRRKVDNVYDFHVARRGNAQRAARLAADARPLTTVRVTRDHRLLALAPAERWTLLVDETGTNFERVGAPGREGRFVAVLLPERTRLPTLSIGFHSAKEPDESLDRALQGLLDADVGVLGVTLRDLPATPGVRWVDGVLELVDWTLLLLPRAVGAPVSLDVRVEARGAHVAGQDWEVAARDLLRRHAARDPESVAAVTLTIRAYAKAQEPRLGYADLVAYTWNGGTDASKARLRASGLPGRSLMEGSAPVLRALWDGFAHDRSPSPEAWSSLVRDPSSDDPLSIAGLLAARLADRAREKPALWAGYLAGAMAHLDSKAIELGGLGRELAWLASAAPNNDMLPPVARHAWARARLAEANHLGLTVADAEREVETLGARLLDERAPAVCEGDLHRAVLATNRFDFDAATRALARWEAVELRVPGLQMWGRVQSSLGQHRAFEGRFDAARDRFDIALAAFDDLSDPRETARERGQTGVYRAIAVMDDPTISDAAALDALESVIGPVDEAIARLGPSTAAAEKYVLHLLLRWAAHRGDAARRRAIVSGAPRWGTGEGHPWQLVCLYRALLLEREGSAESAKPWLRKGVDLAWRPEQGPTVRFIGLVVATLLAARGERDARIAEAIALAHAELPAAADRLQRVERELARPGDALPFIGDVLPFNFR